MKIFIKQSYTKKITAIIFSVMCVPLSSLTSFAGKIHDAAKEGKIEIVRRLLKEKKADVNAKDRHKKTPIYHAAVKGYYGVAELLERNGAEIDCLNEIPIKNEVGYMISIEAYRHNDEKKQIVVDKIKHDLESVKDVGSMSNDLKLYLLSIVFKLYNSQTFLENAQNLIGKLRINLNDPNFYRSQYFSTLLYRALYLPNDNAIVSSVIEKGKDFFNFAFGNDNFKDFDMLSQTHTLRVLSKCVNSGQGIISKAEKEQIISKLKSIDVKSFKSRKSLFVRAKILDDKKKAIELLNMTINELKEEGRLLNTTQGRGAIIALVKVYKDNNQEINQMLKDVIGAIGGLMEAVKNKQGRDAVITFAKNPNNNDSERIEMLSFVVEALGGNEEAAKLEQGRDAMITLARIPHDIGQETSLLNSVIEELGGEKEAVKSKQGRDAIIALGRIPGYEKNRQIGLLESVVGALGGNEEAAKLEQGREAMITLAKIPHDTNQEIRLLNTVIRALGGEDAAAQNKQGRDAMMTLARIPHDKDEEKDLLSSVIEALGGINTAVSSAQGRDAMFSFIKFRPVDETQAIYQIDIVLLLDKSCSSVSEKQQLADVAGCIIDGPSRGFLREDIFLRLKEISRFH